MRDVLVALFRFALKIFYRRIEVVGEAGGDNPVVFAVNHPNGLVDPLFLLCFAPRRVSFLAKAPLFTTPVIGAFVRAFDSVPVYRKQDNTTGSNEETFARARAILSAGGSIAIFPEGTTHSDARLRELKTGAARIALGAQLPSVVIVPTGIYYTAKQTFRSEAAVFFGEPIHVIPSVSEGSGGVGGAPPDLPDPSLTLGMTSVRALTEQIEEGLAALTLQADSHAALELIGRAEDIFSGADTPALTEELPLRRRFVEGYHYLRERDPQRLARLESAIRQFAAELGPRRLEPDALTMPKVIRVLLLFPIALLGAIVHYPTYRIVDLLAGRFARGANEMMATVKFVAALLLYPLTWLAIALVMRQWWLAIALPVLGYVALRVFEDLDDAIGNARAVMHRLFARRAHEQLVAQRQTIRNEIATVADEITGVP